MKRTLVLSSLHSWLNKTHVFFKPSVQLPGKWRLFEYYTEPGGTLVNFKEEHIKKKGQYLEIEFQSTGQLEQDANLPVQFFDGARRYTWRVSRNFITLCQAESSAEIEEFQYAIVKGKLKMLKKDSKGKIEFFGFFRKVE